MSHFNAVGLAGPAFPLDARTYDPNGVGAPRRGAHPGRPGGKKAGPQSRDCRSVFVIYRQQLAVISDSEVNGQRRSVRCRFPQELWDDRYRE